jgi:hypothetical protein
MQTFPCNDVYEFDFIIVLLSHKAVVGWHACTALILLHHQVYSNT